MMSFEIESKVASYCRNFPAVFKTARGEHLYDTNGQKYLDWLMGCGSLNYGHNPPVLKQALLEYMADDGIAMSMDLHTESKADFLNAFETIILNPRDLKYKLQFPGPTGTNAVEAAIKLARKATGRLDIIAFSGAFHGCTLGSLALSSKNYMRVSSRGLLSNTIRIPYEGDYTEQSDVGERLERLVSDTNSGVDLPAAIIVETVQGEGGLNSASTGWLTSLFNFAKKYKIIFIVDDVQAGCGRTGSFFSFEHSEIEPDIICLAKSISGFGLPMSLILVKQHLDVWDVGEHNGTFRGNNLAFVTATAALRTYWGNSDFQNHIIELSDEIEEHLIEIETLFGFTAKGRGLMRGIQLLDEKSGTAIREACFQKGLIVETAGRNNEVLKLLPPLIASKENVRRAFDIIKSELSSIKLKR